MTEFQLLLNYKWNVWLRKASGSSLSVGPSLALGRISNVDIPEKGQSCTTQTWSHEGLLSPYRTNNLCFKPYQRWLSSLNPGGQLANRADNLPPHAHVLRRPPPQDFGQNHGWKDSECDPSRDQNRAAPAWNPQIPMRTRPGVHAGGQGPRAQLPAAHWPQYMRQPSKGHCIGPTSYWTCKLTKMGGVLRL